MHSIFASLRPDALKPWAARVALFLVGWGLLNLPLAAQSNSAIAYTFTTLAGKARAGTIDGAGDVAQFYYPYGIAVDSAGNVFVADTGNHTVRKVTVAGVVSTLAGLAVSPGTNDATGSNARLNTPVGIAVDGSGNLFLADTFNHTIRKVTAAGVVSTIAGAAGSSGTNDGAGGVARFNQPYGIAVDGAENLYVADFGNHTVRKITAAGIVSTLAGQAGSFGTNDGAGNSARFSFPVGVAVDSANNVYVGDSANHTIRKITAAGLVSTFAGVPGSPGTTDGLGSSARFSRPFGIALDNAGNVFVADTDNHTIRAVTPAGAVSTVAGLAGFSGTPDETGSGARFNEPRGVAVDSAGNLYVADSANHTTRKITGAGVVSTPAGFAASSGSTDGTRSNARFNQPYGVVADSAGNVFVADSANHTIRKVTAAGVVSTIAGLAGNLGTNNGAGSKARFYLPVGMALDGGGNLFVADSGSHTIRKVTAAGVVSTFAGLAGNSGTNDGVGVDARFFLPFGLAADGAGNLYVADSANQTIRKITAAGVVSTIAGSPGTSGTNDGAGGSARFYVPVGVAVDSASNIYVADTFNHSIRKITAAGIVSTVAGLGGYFGTEDGSNSNARFTQPAGVTVDSVGTIYVADTFNHTIRKITPDGLVSTLAGLPDYDGSADGTGGNARFNGPYFLTVDSVGNLYVADTLNNTIRKGFFTAYAPTNPTPYTPPPMNGRLTVTLQPPEAHGQWRFPWELGWRESGSTASNLVAGDYSIEFRNTPGWLAIPVSDLVTLSNGATLSTTNQYFPTIGAGDPNSGPGSLTVYLGSIPPPGAGWRFLGEDMPYLPTTYTTNLSPGTYLIEFAPVSGRVRPSSQAVQVSAGLPSFLSVNYLLAATPPSGVYLPLPVPANRQSDIDNYPFGFNGQLQSDTGYGSGVAVQTNVVLTAAHLIFNDQTLSYVKRAHWFFRRDAGVSEPLPLEARGFYVLSGYAAQRTNDLASGYSPDESTPPSRNMDVAALYFSAPVAGGGHGGYLPSDTVPNPWLTSTALKMLVGYPVDGSQFGDASIGPGKMYQTDPQSYPLNISIDPVPTEQQVYTAPWFLGYPGNSGGPLYVQLNGYYYPAAVYLGTLFSGSQPYASIVRALDSNVVNLITMAGSQGDSGTNNTGGGVITIIPSQSISAQNPGYLQFRLTPPAAVRAGAGWRLINDAAYSSAANYTRAVTSTNSFAIEFKPIPGWNSPSNQAVTVLPGQITYPTAFYSVTNPLMVINRAVGIGIRGTTGTTYRIEQRSSLASGTWLPLSTNTINSNGFNLVLPNPAPGFYRLQWLTNF